MKEKVIALVFVFLWQDLIFAQEVTFEPPQSNVAVGQTTLVRCFLVPETQAPTEYHWYDKQGAEITTTASNNPKYVRDARSPLTGKMLYIAVTDDDEGRYKCRIVVGTEEYEGYFQLDTYSTITVSNCEESQHGTKGLEGRMSCTATAGDVNLEAYWERNGFVLTPDSDPRYRFEGTAFVISNVSDDDKGTYTYVAEPKEYSPFITVMRKNINFDVWTLPVIDKPILETNANDGDNATLFCSATGYPSVEFRWYKYSQVINPTGRIKIQRFKDQSQLQFDPVKKDDEGQYTCQANNEAGSAESSTNVIVHTPPKIQVMRNVTETENNGVTLICEANGDPRPRMEWVRVDSGYRFSSGDQSKDKSVSSVDIGDIGNPGTRIRLEFSSVKHSDAGNYRCEALNLAGQDSKVVHLEVMFGPKFDQQPDGPFYNWIGNTDGHLPCVASANPLPLFQWWKGDKEITSADPFFSVVRVEPDETEKYTVTSKLMITFNGQNEKDVFGDFRCEARNTINTTKRVLTMEKASVPGAPQFSKSRETATVLEIQFVSQGVAGPQVTEYKAKITRAGSNDDPRIVTVQAEYRDYVDDRPIPRTTMIIDQLEPSTKYSITVYAINAVGEGTPREMQHTTKAYSEPSSVIVLSEINSEYPAAIWVRWQEPENGGLAIIHYLVEYREVSVKNTTSPQGGYDLLSPIQNQDWNSVQVKSNNIRYTIENLLPGRYYQVQVLAVNSKGPSLPEPKIIKTKEDPSYRPVGGASRQAVVSTIFTLVAAISTACFRSFL